MFEAYNEILTVADVAEILYVGKNTVYNLLESDKLKGFRIGSVWKIPKLALQEFVTSQSNLTIK